MRKDKMEKRNVVVKKWKEKIEKRHTLRYEEKGI